MAEFAAADVPDEGKGRAPGGAAAEDSYPLTVWYCGVCGLPPEYCEYGSTGAECRAWAEANCPEVFAIEEGMAGLENNIAAAAAAAAGATAATAATAPAAKHSTIPTTPSSPHKTILSPVQSGAGNGAEGGEVGEEKEEPKKKGKKVRIAKPGKKGAVGEQRVVIGRLSRNRRKFVTVVGGLDTFPDVKIKDAAKKIGKQFACGSSVSKAPSGAEEVVIQGDVLLDLPGFLETTFDIPAAKISVLST
eukprot:g12673.t2